MTEIEENCSEETTKSRMLLDITKRAEGGIYVYPVIWFVIAFACDLLDTRPELLNFNSILIVITSLLRFSQSRMVLKYSVRHTELLLNTFLFLVLFNALHWGILTAYILQTSSQEDLRFAMLLVAAGLAAAGSAVLSIHWAIRALYPTFLIVPVILVLLIDFNTQNALIAGLCSIFSLYLVVATRAVHDDYWASVMLAERAREMEELSITDSLTQLRNRMFFDIHFDVEWKRAARQKKPLSVLLIDLDLFKRLNDTYGHAFGDLCLKDTASTLSKELKRTGDILARYGGEEFIVMLSDTDLEDAMLVAERLRKSVESIVLCHDTDRVIITCSIGVASTVPMMSDRGHRLINRADKALYLSKSQGRNQVNAG